MIEFYMTGVLPFLFFGHLTERSMGLVEGSRNMLQIPRIGLFDLIAGRAILSASTDLVIAALTLGLLIALGIGHLPHRLHDVLLAYGSLFLLGMGFVLINVVVSAFTSAYEKIWPTFLRIQYFTSGVFYHPSDMPEDVRAIILLNPLVHVTEWMRQGYYAHYESPFLDEGYLLRWILGTLMLGTLLLAASAQRVRRHD
jgi:capsular polysaccharide transport system permease protein